MRLSSFISDALKSAGGLLLVAVMFYLLLFFSGIGCSTHRKAILEKPWTPSETDKNAPPVIAQAQESLGFPAQFGEGGLSPIHFEFDRYEIRDQDAVILTMNAGKMVGMQQGVVVEGHCDERGTFGYNLALGQRRADTTLKYLVRMGVDPKLLRTVSYGEEKPVDSGHTEAAWRKNRRAEFVVFQGE